MYENIKLSARKFNSPNVCKEMYLKSRLLLNCNDRILHHSSRKYPPTKSNVPPLEGILLINSNLGMPV